MRNFKCLLLFSVVFFLTQNSFAQSEECKKKVGAIVEDYHKKISATPDITREKAMVMMDDFMATAKSKYPDCFPKDFDKKMAAAKKADEQKIQKEEKKELEKRKKKAAPKEAKLNLPKEVVEKQKEMKSVNKNSAEYKAFRKECMKEMNATIKELREKSNGTLEGAKTPDEQKAVRAAFQKMKSEILDGCATEKMNQHH